MAAEARDGIRQRYEADRRERASTARVSPPGVCRYCGRRWIPWSGSTLDGHSRCIVTEAFKRELAQLFATEPLLTYNAVAAHLGVTIAVLRSWVAPIASARRTNVELRKDVRI